jgi:hypothetical protein
MPGKRGRHLLLKSRALLPQLRLRGDEVCGSLILLVSSERRYQSCLVKSFMYALIWLKLSACISLLLPGSWPSKADCQVRYH